MSASIQFAHVIIGGGQTPDTVAMKRASRHISVFENEFQRAGAQTFKIEPTQAQAVVSDNANVVHLVSGFNASGAVAQYAKHCLERRIAVVVLDDCVSNDKAGILDGASKPATLADLQSAGAQIMSGEKAAYYVRHPEAFPGLTRA